jgi:hypothetical protein
MTRGTETPFFIPFRDRITYLRELMKWLRYHGVPNDLIIISDNGTTYPEAVDQLHEWNKEGVQVLWQKANLGAWSLFSGRDSKYHGIIEGLIGTAERFFVNDPDVIPLGTCRSDLLDYHHELLDRYDSLAKVGLSLRINDIPDHFKHKAHVLRHEERYWKEDYQSYEKAPVKELYSAPIATTFALYRNLDAIHEGDPKPPRGCGRTKPPNEAAHLPWYMDVNDILPDERWYFEHCPHRTVPKVPGASWKPDLPSPP